MRERNKDAYLSMAHESDEQMQASDTKTKSVPLVSVAMCTYNHQDYIAKAIEGVLMQDTTFPVELCIGEDCSTDRTREIALTYQRDNPDSVRVLSGTRNIGMHANWKRTIASCRGKYIAVCEGDDFWSHPKKLQMQIEILEQHANVGLVHGAVNYYDVENSEEAGPSRAMPEWLASRQELLWEMIRGAYTVETCTSIFRRSMHDDIMAECEFEFDERFPMTDVQTWWEIAHRADVSYIREILATRHLLPESASRSRDVAKQIQFAKGARDIRSHYAQKFGGEMTLPIRSAVIRKYNRGLLYTAVQCRDPYLAAEVRRHSRQNNVRLDCLSLVCFLAAKSRLLSYPVQMLLHAKARFTKWKHKNTA